MTKKRGSKKRDATIVNFLILLIFFGASAQYECEMMHKNGTKLNITSWEAHTTFSKDTLMDGNSTKRNPNGLQRKEKYGVNAFVKRTRVISDDLFPNTGKNTLDKIQCADLENGPKKRAAVENWWSLFITTQRMNILLDKKTEYIDENIETDESENEIAISNIIDQVINEQVDIDTKITTLTPPKSNFRIPFKNPSEKQVGRTTSGTKDMTIRNRLEDTFDLIPDNDEQLANININKEKFNIESNLKTLKNLKSTVQKVPENNLINKGQNKTKDFYNEHPFNVMNDQINYSLEKEINKIDLSNDRTIKGQNEVIGEIQYRHTTREIKAMTTRNGLEDKFDLISENDEQLPNIDINSNQFNIGSIWKIFKKLKSNVEKIPENNFINKVQNKTKDFYNEHPLNVTNDQINYSLEKENFPINGIDLSKDRIIKEQNEVINKLMKTKQKSKTRRKNHRFHVTTENIALQQTYLKDLSHNSDNQNQFEESINMDNSGYMKSSEENSTLLKCYDQKEHLEESLLSDWAKCSLASCYTMVQSNANAPLVTRSCGHSGVCGRLRSSLDSVSYCRECDWDFCNDDEPEWRGGGGHSVATSVVASVALVLLCALVANLFV